MDEPYPYDPPPRGAKYWQQRFPNKGPDRTPKPQEPVKGNDGKDRSPDYFRRSLGERPAAADPGDMGVHDWAPV